MIDFLKKYQNVWNMLLIFIGILFLISTLNYFGILGSVLSAILNMLLGAIILFYLGFKKGQKRDNKGYIAGLKYGVLMILIMFLISFLLFKMLPNVVMFVYYGILLLSCILGSMVGINKKKEE